MTREDIVEQMAALQSKLDEIDKEKKRGYVIESLTGAEKEKAASGRFATA